MKNLYESLLDSKEERARRVKESNFQSVVKKIYDLICKYTTDDFQYNFIAGGLDLSIGGRTNKPIPDQISTAQKFEESMKKLSSEIDKIREVKGTKCSFTKEANKERKPRDCTITISFEDGLEEKYNGFLYSVNFFVKYSLDHHRYYIGDDTIKSLLLSIYMDSDTNGTPNEDDALEFLRMLTDMFKK